MISRARADVGINLLVLTTLGVLLALVAAVVLGFRQSINLVNAVDRDAERQLVSRYLDRSAVNMVAQQKVQLTWDDAFKHAAGKVDPVWADTYIGQFLYSNFHYDRLYLVDPEGRLLRAWIDGAPVPNGGYSALSGQVADTLKTMATRGNVFGDAGGSRKLADTNWPVDSDGLVLTRWATALVRLDGRPGRMTISSIVPDTNMNLLKRTPNHLVAVRYFDAAYLADIRSALLLPELSVASEPPRNDQLNALALAGPGGRIYGWLNWPMAGHSAIVVQRMRPVFIAFLCFLTALIVGVWTIVRMLLATMYKLQASERRAVHEARHDAMTGLPNRQQFLKQLERKLTRHAGKPDKMVAVAFFDLDHFKLINDTLGHAAGDELVRQVAQRCRLRLGKDDVLARIGGDEFVVMRVGSRADGGIKRLGRELMGIFAAPFKIDGRVTDVTVSCGISWAPDQATTASDLLRNADIALFRAKQRGRARWRAFSSEMADEVTRRIELETELRKALQNDSLELAYQPIVRADDGSIEGVEALLRWQHPTLGEISPSVFVPVAEQAGLMNLLGWWMLTRVFGHASAWPQLNISINLSPLQLAAHGFLEDLDVLLREHFVAPSRVTFEVTEGILMERRSAVFDVLANLKDMGFGIALDDFGTGYSSLGYLRSFQFDRIKIDRSFVQNIEDDSDAQAILVTIVALGQNLGIRTVAEGVETGMQRQLVVAAGCDLIQGFYYWHPMRAEQVSELLSALDKGQPAVIHGIHAA
ncbi:putative bifunctional diguanylate cyclase/phosphodiesterase [Novosphingobium sp.]|uniref:putative bifunctional diguanylate cyclase/phosphodiesterase n=1 Tax=Novosphingobium sp. TaxID=1874826 RepID=UPI0035B17270